MLSALPMFRSYPSVRETFWIKVREYIIYWALLYTANSQMFCNLSFLWPYYSLYHKSPIPYTCPIPSGHLSYFLYVPLQPPCCINNHLLFFYQDGKAKVSSERRKSCPYGQWAWYGDSWHSKVLWDIYQYHQTEVTI